MHYNRFSEDDIKMKHTIEYAVGGKDLSLNLVASTGRVGDLFYITGMLDAEANDQTDAYLTSLTFDIDVVVENYNQAAQNFIPSGLTAGIVKIPQGTTILETICAVEDTPTLLKTLLGDKIDNEYVYKIMARGRTPYAVTSIADDNVKQRAYFKLKGTYKPSKAQLRKGEGAVSDEDRSAPDSILELIVCYNNGRVPLIEALLVFARAHVIMRYETRNRAQNSKF
jgi:hypothetical protein